MKTHTVAFSANFLVAAFVAASEALCAEIYERECINPFGPAAGIGHSSKSRTRRMAPC